MATIAGEGIFKRIAVSERKFLFREAASDKTVLSIKDDDGNVFHLMAVQCERDEVLLCNHTDDSEAFEKNQKVVVNFVFGGERYFFQSELSFAAGWAVIKIDLDVFQIHRRANARLDLPEKFEGHFTIHQHGGKRYFQECKVKDISAGGIKIEFSGQQVPAKVGDKITGSLRLGVRRAMELEFEVRFVASKEVGSSYTQTWGLQFQNVDFTLENRLLSLMMDLQREVFLKHAKR